MSATSLPHLGQMFDDVDDEPAISRVWLKLRIEHTHGAFETLAGQVAGNEIELLAPGGGRGLAKGDLAFVMLLDDHGKAITARVVSSESCAAGRRVTMRLSESIRALLAA